MYFIGSLVAPQRERRKKELNLRADDDDVPSDETIGRKSDNGGKRTSKFHFERRNWSGIAGWVIRHVWGEAESVDLCDLFAACLSLTFWRMFAGKVHGGT